MFRKTSFNAFSLPILALILALKMSVTASAQVESVDYKNFLGQHDMIWDIVPNRWEVAPYTGNGNVGLLP